MNRSMARRVDILRQEQDWENARLETTAKQQTAAAQQEAAAAKEQLALAERRAAATQETTVRNLLKQGRFTVEEIADICGTAPEQVRQMQTE
jgi:hypothetical protein